MFALFVSSKQVSGGFEQIIAGSDRYVCSNGSDKLEILYASVPGATIGEYVAPPPPPPSRDELIAQRDAAVAAIKVTTTAGNTFDGDEVSQGRMSRAVVAMGAAPAGSTVNWVLADNSVIEATQEELTEALLLAGTAQAALWVI